MYKRLFLVLIIVLMISSPICAKGLGWKAVNYSSPDLIKESGLTIEEFNNLSQSEWLNLFNGKEKVNFAFSATSENGDDITDKTNPNLSIIVKGSNQDQLVNFEYLLLDDGPDAPRGEKADSLNDQDGDGYLDIWYLEQLAYVGTDETTLGKNFELMRSLDFYNPSHYLNPEVNKHKWVSGEGWLPLGHYQNGEPSKEFRGFFNGNHYEIKNLYINRPTTSYIGLFQKTIRGRISNVLLTNVNITGQQYVGGLIGYMNYGRDYNRRYGQSLIEKSMVQGNINGSSIVGGLAGYNYYSHIRESISHANITGEENSGGLVGYFRYGNSIINSYSTGKISSGYRNGGFVGSHVADAADILNSYSIGEVNGGGFVGHSNGTVRRSFWDKDTSGAATSYRGVGLTTSEMKTAQTFIDVGWNTDIWELKDGQYPKLKWEKTI
ncbi:MAG: hypothetical protein ACOCV1_08420 [Bacillota bacterium]